VNPVLIRTIINYRHSFGTDAIMVEYSRRDALRIGGGAGLLLLGGTATVSADEDDGDGEAGLRVAHGSPDAPAVDVLVDGGVAVSGLEFRSVTDYLELDAGEYEIAVNVTGTDTTVIGPLSVELENEDYTAVALGEVGEETLTLSLFEDTNGANIGDDEARVRAIHASPDAPTVDVTVNHGALTLFDGLAFGESSGYAVVPATTYEVEVRPDTEDNDGTVVSEAEVTLEGGSTYTVFAFGYLTPDDEPADEGFALEPVLDKSAPPRGDGRGRGRGDDGDDGDDDEEGRGRGRGRGDD
jgi:hypothetical protein